MTKPLSKNKASILDLLKEKRVFSIVKTGGKFLVSEECDRYFSESLGKKEMLLLAEEIRLMALRNSRGYDD